MIRKLLIAGYGLTIVAGLYLRSSEDLVYNFESSRPWVWAVLLFFMLTMFWSYGHVKPAKIGRLTPLFQSTLIGLGLISLYGGILLLPSYGAVTNLLTYNSLEVFAEVYDNNRANGNQAGVNIPVVLFNATRDLFTLVFFVGIANKNISRHLYALSALLLTVAILNSVLHGFRNVLSFLILDLLFFYFYLERTLSFEVRQRLLAKLRILFVITVVFITALTVGRFSTSYTTLENPANSALHYIGQAPNFIETAIGRNGGHGGGSRTFALVNNIVFNGPSGFEERREINSHLEYDDRYFFYWFGDILVDNGPLGIVIILIILLLVGMRRRFRLKGIRHLFLEYIIWILFAHGLFLNPFGDIVGNISFILLLFLGIFAREIAYD